MKFCFIYIILSTFGCALFGQQMGSELIDAAKVGPWIPKESINYQGAYHFGDSESESSLVILYDAFETVAQIRSTTPDGKNHYKNLTHVRIEGYHFYSDQTNGTFVLYSGDEHPVKGLKVDRPWSGTVGPDHYEIGYRTSNVVFAGDFPQASIRVLAIKELEAMKPWDLKVMRNEIFGRYGYIFRKKGVMDLHFSEQSWYRQQHKNITPYLTPIELKNIELITKVESGTKEH